MSNKQKLQLKFKNAPGDASQVPCSTSLALNKVERLSVSGKVLDCNSLDGNHQQHGAGRNLRVSDIVYVLNMRGEPLMPTKHKKAKTLLRENKAKVVKRLPFTIQLTTQTGETKQEISLGIDSGAKFIGFSAVSAKAELISGEVVLDVLMSKRIEDRAMYRRNKRNRLWYRKPRFQNREKGCNWLPPSVQRRYDTHLSLTTRVKKLLPVSDVTIEVGNFDIQKIKNPEIVGAGYQQGDQSGYANTKAYVMARERHLCQLCNKTVLGKKINLHHIIPRRQGGTDKADNMALLHEACHKRLHKLSLENSLSKNKQYKESTFMNIIKWRFKKDIDCVLTFGYKTFCERLALSLPKSHANDAFVIAGGKGQIRCREFEISQHRKNNRCLQLNRKGFAPAIRKQRYSVQPNDLIKVNNKWYESGGTHCKGKRIIVNKKSINIKLIESVIHAGTLKWRMAIPPSVKTEGLLAIS